VEIVVPGVSGDPLAAALALHQAGRTDDAIAACRAVLRGRPGDARAHQLLGGLLLARGRPADAVGHLETAVRLSPGLAGVRLQVAVLLHQLGRLPEAARGYRRALALSPETVDAHGNLGLIGPSATRLARAVALRPGDAQMLGNLGAIAGSASILRRAVALAPGDGALHLNAGNQQRDAGEIEAAERAYRRAMAAGRRSDALANLALAAHDTDRALEAACRTRQALADAPASPYALSNGSAVWKRLGRIGAAVLAARRSLACADSPEAWNNLGDALQSLGETRAAADCYRRSGEAGGSPAWGSNLLFQDSLPRRDGVGRAACAAEPAETGASYGGCAAGGGGAVDGFPRPSGRAERARDLRASPAGVAARLCRGGAGRRGDGGVPERVGRLDLDGGTERRGGG
jgi:tetratricopeptide (TPR) repeat protein